MALPSIDEAVVRASASAESFSRGESYYRSGAVGELTQRGATLHAEVEGSEYPAYQVRVTFDGGGVVSASCSCPYDWGGWCKHIVAALLKRIREPGALDVRPPLSEVLADVAQAQLVRLIVELAEVFPGLADEAERRLLLTKLAPGQSAARPAASRVRRSAIDQASIRKLVQAAMRPRYRNRYADYDDEEDPGADAVEAVRPLLDRARAFTAAGDGRSALEVLEALSEAYVLDGEGLFAELEEMLGSVEGVAVDFLDELADAWAEAVLTADLSADEREVWAETIASIGEAAEELASADVFAMALAAAEQGWDYPPLVRVLGGQVDERGAWEGEAPDYADALALVRLRLLERQGRLQEYLYLAEAEGQSDRYAVMLAKLGRTAEAVAHGVAHLSAPAEVMEVARIVRERGDLEGALRLAEHGMSRPPAQRPGTLVYYGEHERAELASWATDLAQGLGHRERAVQAAEVAFRLMPSLTAYQKVRDLAGDGWTSIRPKLLDYLKKSHAAEAKVAVFLHEGLIDNAIGAVKDGYYPSLMLQVMDAATGTRPTWVIQAATRQAEQIMDAGRAGHYQEAASWLARARDAYRAAGREAGWDAYIADIRTKHGRKYKLMGLIERL